MAEKETVQTSTVEAEIGDTTVEPTFVQRAGLRLALGVGALIFMVTFGSVIFLYTHYPSMPSANTLISSPDSKSQIEQYKQISDIAVKSTEDIFHTIVTQALLPVFTAILGYIFANGAREDGRR